MKILVKNLKSNPFRNLDNYPIDREKIERLKISIQKTSFWDNIVARPHPKKEGKYQIAYGHHRLIAIIELKIKKVNIPIRELEDATMLQMMADENLEWNASPAVINETVYAVKEFLDKELVKAEWGLANKFIKQLFTTHERYNQIRNGLLNKDGEGIGQTTILKFLNGGKKKGNWKQYMIQDALELKKEDDKGIVDKKAVEELRTPYAAKRFREAVKTYHIPKAKQKEIAKKIKKEKIGGRGISKIVRNSVKKKPAIDPALTKLEKTFDDIDKYADTLRYKIAGFRMQMEDLNVTQIKGAKAFITLTSLVQLQKEINGLLNINQTKQIEGNVK